MTAFILNEEAARDWVTDLVMIHEFGDVGTASSDEPGIDLDWRPREPGQEDAVETLVRRANDRPDVLIRPEHAEVAIEFVDDGDDWSYRFLLLISAPAPVTLTSEPRRLRQLGDASAGVDAAVGILREAARTADTLAERLRAYVQATVRDASQ